MCWLAGGPEKIHYAIIHRTQPGGILLFDNYISQGGGYQPGIFPLGERRSLGAIPHGLTAVEQQIAGEIGLGFILFQIVTIRFGVDFPVDITQVIAGRVLPMLGELGGKTVKRAFMCPGNVAFHNLSRRQIQVLNLSERLRI